MPELLVEPVWSWPLAVLASAALIGVVLVTYPPRVAHLPPLWRRILIGLRLLAALVLIFALLRPALRYSDIDKQAAQLVVLTDVSKSMTTGDGAAGMTRREALLEILKNANPQLKQLAEEVELRFIDFAEDLTPVETPSAQAEGRQTAIGKALDELRREDAGKRLAGILLLSDGAERTLGADAIDPRTAARRFAEERGVPIHTVTFGSSELTGAGLDYAIEDVVVDPLAYEKKTVPVRFQLRAGGAAGRQARIRLLIERQSGTGETAKSEMVELPRTADSKPFDVVEINGNRSLRTQELSFVAEQAGEYKLAVEVVPAEGEAQLANNRYETVMTVLKGGLKVAYFDVARSVEQKFIRRLNENARIQLDVFLVPGGKFFEQARIDPELFQPGRFDVYLIGDVPAFVFRQGGRDLLQDLADRCRDRQQGAGLGMLGGAYSFGTGGYANTPIAPLLPVPMSPAERVEVGQEPPASQFIPGPIQMLPGPDGVNHYLMQIGPNSEELWRSLPALKAGANRLSAKNATVSLLAMTQQRDPLLLAWDTGFNRVLALGVSDTWRWWTHGFESIHQRFWEQLLLWLARMENESDQPVWVKVSPRNFAPGDRVTATFGARDEQQRPITDVTFSVEVIAPDGRSQLIPSQKIGDEFSADFSSVTKPGDYQVLVTASRNGAVYGAPARTRFIVDARDPELDNPAADPNLMAEIATITGAAPIAPENLPAFLDDLLQEGLNTEVTRYTQINLWDGWPLLLVFVSLLVTEWFVRKRRGLV
ncbi:MAG: hypothetical protein ACK5Q5_21490 [Planctomycetaceae bacterium]